MLSVSYLQYPDGLVEHRLGVGVVVGAGQLQVGEVGLQQQVSLGVGRVQLHLVHRDRTEFGQLSATP